MKRTGLALTAAAYLALATACAGPSREAYLYVAAP